MLLTEGQMSDHKGAVLLFSRLPQAKELLADKGYDSDWFRRALTSRGITPCIPPTASRKVQLPYDKQLYRQRHKIENLFARLKDCDALQPAMTDAPTLSCRPSLSPQPSASGSEQ